MLEELEPRVLVVERAAELIAGTLFAIRREIDAVEARMDRSGPSELAGRVERLAQNLALLESRVARIGAALRRAPAPAGGGAG